MRGHSEPSPLLGGPIPMGRLGPYLGALERDVVVTDDVAHMHARDLKVGKGLFNLGVQCFHCDCRFLLHAFENKSHVASLDLVRHALAQAKGASERDQVE